MENVYDLKVKNNYNFILPTSCNISTEEIDYSKIIIVVHLFYTKNLDYYFSYLRNVPHEIKILFTYSDEKKLEIIQEYVNEYSINAIYRHKENRGRDLSALLVAAANDILEYEYVCFVHDKKAKRRVDKRDTALFIECLWENSLSSTQYINNIIHTFKQNKEIGVLLPPESMSKNFMFVQKNTWDNDFKIMKQLARKAELNCNLDKNKKPLSLGTVFWARVDAIKKMLEMEWKYEDFPEEPMPLDGTINHALERSFAYFAQDAGYATGIVMSDVYAGHRIDVYQDYIFKAFKILSDEFSIMTYFKMWEWLKRRKKTPEKISYFSKRYIYGAGWYGKMCEKSLLLDGVMMDGFLVSKKENNPDDIDGFPVYECSEIEYNAETCVIVAVNDKTFVKDITATLSEMNIDKDNVFYYPWR